MKKKILELLVQILPVMLGVYLGFVVSEWSDNNQKKSDSKIFKSSLISEIKANEQRLKTVVDYHTMVRDSSRYYSNEKNLSVRPKYFKGTRLRKLSNSAFNTGIQTGVINELPIDQIQLLNQLYTFQKDYNEFGNMILSSLLNKDFSNESSDLSEIARFLSVSMTDVVIKENDLLGGYKMTLEKIKN